MWCVKRVSILSVVALFTVISGPHLVTSARAEVKPSDITIPANTAGLGPGYGRRGLQFRLDLGLFTGDGELGDAKASRTAVASRLRIAQPMGKNEAEVSFGFSRFASTVGEGESEISASTVRFGNPSLTYFFVWRTLRRQIRLGLGVTAPLSRLRNEKPEDQLIDYDALMTQLESSGYKERWLWRLNSMSTLLQADYAARFRSGFIVGTNVVVAPMFKVGDSVRAFEGAEGSLPRKTPDITIAIQADLELAYDSEYVRSSLGVTYSTETDSDVSDEAKNQLAIVPEFRFRMGDIDLLTSLNLPSKSLSGNPFGDGMFWSAFIGIATATELTLPE